jgi:hypothetical protein
VILFNQITRFCSNPIKQFEAVVARQGLLLFLIVRSDLKKNPKNPLRPSRLRGSLTPEDLKDIGN